MNIKVCDDWCLLPLTIGTASKTLQNLQNKIANLWHCVDLTNSIIIIAIVITVVFVWNLAYFNDKKKVKFEC